MFEQFHFCIAPACRRAPLLSEELDPERVAQRDALDHLLVHGDKPPGVTSVKDAHALRPAGDLFETCSRLTGAI